MVRAMVDAGVMAGIQPLAALDGAQHHQCHCVRWTCVQTHSQAERWAESNLRRQGYPTYLPLLAVSRPDRVVRSMRHAVLVPLFSGYVFVQHDPETSWGPLRDTPGVRGVLRCGNRIQYARAGAVEALQAGEVVRRCRGSGHGAAWRPGAAAGLARGVFAGHRAVIVAVREETAVVAVLMFGELRDVTVPLDALVEGS